MPTLEIIIMMIVASSLFYSELSPSRTTLNHGFIQGSQILSCVNLWFTFYIFSILVFFRDCVPGVLVCSLLWALHRRAAFLPGRHLRLQEVLALCGGLLALLSALDPATPPGLEQLWARGTRDYMLCPVAPPFTQQRLIRVVSLHLLPAAAPSGDDLLLWQDPGGNQEGEFIIICTLS